MLYQEHKSEIEMIRNATGVAFVDVLGTKDASLNALALNGGDARMISKLVEISTLYGFIARICEIDSALYATAFSDSVCIVRDGWERLILDIIALFQISCLTNEFRIRAGIEIGNVYGKASLQDGLAQLMEERNINNFNIPEYYFGDAITGAAVAERRLNGSRISFGDTITSIIDKYKKYLLVEINDLFIARNDGTKMFYEVNWMRPEATVAIFDQLNKLERFTRPNDTLPFARKRWSQVPTDEYCKTMSELAYEFVGEVRSQHKT